MDFAFKMYDGHMGPRYFIHHALDHMFEKTNGDIRRFWRECLPRLKYYNPTVSMTVSRTENFEGPALMTVHFAETTAATSPEANSSTSTEPAPTTSIEPVPTTDTTPAPVSIRTEVINMKHRHSSDIMNNLMNLTKATPVEPSQEDIELSQRLEAEFQKIAEEQVRARAANVEHRKQKALLEAAKASAALL